MRTYAFADIHITNEDFWKDRYKEAMEAFRIINDPHVTEEDREQAKVDYTNLLEKDALLSRLYAYIQRKFPRYDATREKAPMGSHPKCSYWWNGVCEFRIEEETKTEFRLTLTSYVACGNYDSIEITVSKADL